MKDISQQLNAWLARASLQADRYTMAAGCLLVLLLIATAQMVIYSSFEARGHVNHLHQLEKARNLMQVEWGQLLLEESAWASHSRVESMVTQELAMGVPEAKNIILVSQP
jgi:cell division protein FtsL